MILVGGDLAHLEIARAHLVGRNRTGVEGADQSDQPAEREHGQVALDVAIGSNISALDDEPAPSETSFRLRAPSASRARLVFQQRTRRPSQAHAAADHARTSRSNATLVSSRRRMVSPRARRRPTGGSPPSGRRGYRATFPTFEIFSFDF